MYTCIDDYGNLKPSRRQFILNATPVTTWRSDDMIPLTEWEMDDGGAWTCLVVWRDDPDGIVLCAYY